MFFFLHIIGPLNPDGIGVNGGGNGSDGGKMLTWLSAIGGGIIGAINEEAAVKVGTDGVVNKFREAAIKLESLIELPQLDDSNWFNFKSEDEEVLFSFMVTNDTVTSRLESEDNWRFFDLLLLLAFNPAALADNPDANDLALNPLAFVFNGVSVEFVIVIPDSDLIWILVNSFPAAALILVALPDNLRPESSIKLPFLIVPHFIKLGGPMFVEVEMIVDVPSDLFELLIMMVLAAEEDGRRDADLDFVVVVIVIFGGGPSTEGAAAGEAGVLETWTELGGRDGGLDGGRDGGLDPALEEVVEVVPNWTTWSSLAWARAAFRASASRALSCFFVGLISFPMARKASSFRTRCFSNNSSNGTDLPWTCLRNVNEWDLQVNDRVHSLTMDSVLTPQCLSGSYLLSLQGNNFSLSMDIAAEAAAEVLPPLPLLLAPLLLLDLLTLGMGDEEGEGGADAEEGL